MPSIGTDPRCRLVEQQNGASKPGFFGDGSCRCRICGTGVGDDAGGNTRAIRHSGALGSCSRLGNRNLAGRFRAPLPGGRPAVARVGGRWDADVVANPQFHFLSEY